MDLDPQCASRTLRRPSANNVRLRELRLNGIGLDLDSYRAICEGAASNPHLQFLSLRGNPMNVAAIRHVLFCSPSSSLRQLDISNADWPPGAFEEITHLLRTNVVVDSFRCSIVDEGYLTVLLDLVSTYNFTIVDLPVGPPYWSNDVRRRIDMTVYYNHETRESYRRIREQVPRVVGEERRLALWPEAIARIGHFPTLVYRLLKHGDNAAAVVECILRRGRRRKLPMDGSSLDCR